MWSSLPVVGGLFRVTPRQQIIDNIRHSHDVTASFKAQLADELRKINDDLLETKRRFLDGLFWAHYIGRRDVLPAIQQRGLAELEIKGFSLIKRAILMLHVDECLKNMDYALSLLEGREWTTDRVGIQGDLLCVEGSPEPELLAATQKLAEIEPKDIMERVNQLPAMTALQHKQAALRDGLLTEAWGPISALLSSRNFDLPEDRGGILHDILTKIGIYSSTFAVLHKKYNAALGPPEDEGLRGLHEVLHPAARYVFLLLLLPADEILRNTNMTGDQFFSVLIKQATSPDAKGSKAGYTEEQMLRFAVVWSLLCKGEIVSVEDATASLSELHTTFGEIATDWVAEMAFVLCEMHRLWRELQEHVRIFCGLLCDQRYPLGKRLQQLSEEIFIAHDKTRKYVFCQGLTEYLELKVDVVELWRRVPESVRTLLPEQSLMRYILPAGATSNLSQYSTNGGNMSVNGLTVSGNTITMAGGAQIVLGGGSGGASNVVIYNSGTATTPSYSTPTSAASETPGFTSGGSTVYLGGAASIGGGDDRGAGCADRSRTSSFAETATARQTSNPSYTTNTPSVSHPPKSDSSGGVRSVSAAATATPSLAPQRTPQAEAMARAMLADGVTVTEPYCNNLVGVLMELSKIISKILDNAGLLSTLNVAEMKLDSPFPANLSGSAAGTVLKFLLQSELSYRMLYVFQKGCDVVRRSFMEAVMGTASRTSRSAHLYAASLYNEANKQAAVPQYACILSKRAREVADFDVHWSALRNSMAWTELDIKDFDDNGHVFTDVRGLSYFSVAKSLASSWKFCHEAYSLYAYVNATLHALRVEGNARLQAAGKMPAATSEDLVAAATFIWSTAAHPCPHAVFAVIEAYGIDLLSGQRDGQFQFAVTMLWSSIKGIVGVAARQKEVFVVEDDTASYASQSTVATAKRLEKSNTQVTQQKARSIAAELRAAADVASSISDQSSMRVEDIQALLARLSDMTDKLRGDIGSLSRIVSVEVSTAERAATYIDTSDSLFRLVDDLRQTEGASLRKAEDDSYYFGKYSKKAVMAVAGVVHGLLK